MAEALAVVTIAAANYVPQTVAMAASLRRFHPETPLYVVLAGARRSVPELERLGARIVPLAELRVEGLRGMMLRYGCKELCAALKPSAIEKVLEAGHHTAVFVDPDMLVLDSLTVCFGHASAHSLLLTPHIGPEAAGRPDEELERALLMAGMFNGGFIGATDCGETRRFLEWWAGRLRTHCYEDVEAGMHFDQRWLDLAPGFVTGLHVCHHAGCNAAYWRLGRMRMEQRGAAFFLGGDPVRLFHFSGYDPAAPEFVTKFRPGWRVEETGAGAALFRLYQERLREAGWRCGAQEEPGLPETGRALQFVRRARRVARRAAARWRSR